MPRRLSRGLPEVEGIAGFQQDAEYTSGKTWGSVLRLAIGATTTTCDTFLEDDNRHREGSAR